MSNSESSRHRVPPYKRPLVIGLFLLALAIVMMVTILICKNFLKSSSTSESSDSDSSQSISTPPEDTPPADPDEPLENKTPQYEGEDPNTLDELTGHVIYTDIDPETSTLHSSVMINQFLQSDGQCIYNIKRDDVILRTASAVASADITTSVCGPFSISLAGLSPGDYQIEVIVTGDDKRGLITDDLTI